MSSELEKIKTHVDKALKIRLKGLKNMGVIRTCLLYTSPDLTVGALNITVGDLEIITVTGPKDATGLITLTLNGIAVSYTHLQLRWMLHMKF